MTRPSKFAPDFRARAIDLYRFSEGWGRYRRLTSEVGADEAGVDTDMDGILRRSLAACRKPTLFRVLVTGH